MRRALTVLVLTVLATASMLRPVPVTESPAATGPVLARSLPPETPVRLPAGVSRRVVRFRVGHLPRSYVLVAARRPAALSTLLVVLPGWHQTAEKVERIEGWDRFVAAGHVVVVYGSGYGGSWNAGTCCRPAVADRVDDVAYLTQVLHRTARAYRIDLRRIYLAGFSNGGMMAYRYACVHSRAVAAISVVSGTLADPRCSPDSPVSVLHVHGLRDDTVPFTGSRFSPVLHEPTIAVSLALAPWRLVDAGTGAATTLVVLPTFDHRWPTRHNSGYDATGRAWAFFLEHPQILRTPAPTAPGAGAAAVQAVRAGAGQGSPARPVATATRCRSCGRPRAAA